MAPVRHGKKWRIRWLDEDGHRQSEVYAHKRDATFKEQEHHREVEEIVRGLRARPVAGHSVAEACDYWLKNRNVFKRSKKDDPYYIRKYILPGLGSRRVRELTPAMVDEFKLTHLGHLSDKSKANVLTFLISLLYLARDLGWLDKVFKIQKPRIRINAKDLRYLKSTEEVSRLLDAAMVEGWPVYALYATAIYTGMRAGELAGLRWDDVDLKTRLITVQRSFHGPTKGGEVRYVPILDPLLPILEHWRGLGIGGDAVFTGQTGRMLLKSGRVYEEILHRVLARAGFRSTTKQNGNQKPYIVFHDLRHTFASHWMMRGGDLFKLQKILGHKTVQMTMRYAHLQPEAFAADYSRLGGKVLHAGREHAAAEDPAAAARRTLH